jgi:hypothetical protein
VVLIHLDSGFQPGDVLHRETAAFREWYRHNVAHAELEYPYFPLDPACHDHPGYAYWNQRLREVIEVAGMHQAARGSLIVKWFPYPSQHLSSNSRHIGASLADANG